MSQSLTTVPVVPADVHRIRPPRRLRRTLAVGFALVLAASALVALVRSQLEHPVPLASLPVGACFTEHGTDLRTVLPASCTDPHHGEVAGQVAIGPEQDPYHDPELAAATACSPAFTAYVPDYWALPPWIGYISVPPADQDLTHRPLATCYLAAHNGPVTTSQRTPGAPLTDAQRGYLDAVDRYDEVSSLAVDERTSAGPDALHDWTVQMAAAEQQLTEGLGRLTPPPGAEREFGRVLDAHRDAAARWQIAAGLDRDLLRTVAAARDADHAAMDPDGAVRHALGLSTMMRPRGWSL
ncbi:hypothetical protein [Streptomyces sp. TLI_171]|uniref:hypothetical protein n=1 Tax=Streptomyces sp. TLI_171 TaxID=1938859 RepID=UPI000C1A7E22|nr:hypothetical protein [Streptomyces sp. TLI_171]RKE17620.1 hypothetical protein BX266_0881 [Streptomyces sp. TLI_171]